MWKTFRKDPIRHVFFDKKIFTSRADARRKWNRAKEFIADCREIYSG